MLSEAKHLLYLTENDQNRSFASLRLTWYRGFFINLLGWDFGLQHLRAQRETTDIGR
jgi:hypothetical protein